MQRVRDELDEDGNRSRWPQHVESAIVVPASFE
jgi:hypothetical protein